MELFQLHDLNQWYIMNNVNFQYYQIILSSGSNHQVQCKCYYWFYFYYIFMNDIIDGKILRKYEVIKKIGKGAYGQVWKVINKKNSIKAPTNRHDKDHQNEIRALKKVCDCFRNAIDCQRTYRQIAYLQKIEHPNIIKLLDYDKSTNQRDVYIEMQCMESDLSTVLKNGYLNDVQKKIVFIQIVSGIAYLHSAKLMHRDIKPSNILIGSNCEAKLCDFGLVRAFGETNSDEPKEFSENIATRWYKAPQLLLSSNNYGPAVDIWGLGCVFGEILSGKPLFQGSSTFNQLDKILEYIDKPTESMNEYVKSETALAILHSIVSSEGQDSHKENKKNLQKLLPSIKEDALDLLNGLLRFHPKERLTIQEVMKHPYITQKTKYSETIKFKFSEKPIRIEGDMQINKIPISTSNEASKQKISDKSFDKISSKHQNAILFYKTLLFDYKQLKSNEQPQTNGSQHSEAKLHLISHTKKIETQLKQNPTTEIKIINKNKLQLKEKSPNTKVKSKDVKPSISQKRIGQKISIGTVQNKGHQQWGSAKKIDKSKQSIGQSKSQNSIGDKSNDINKSRKKITKVGEKTGCSGIVLVKNKQNNLVVKDGQKMGHHKMGKVIGVEEKKQEKDHSHHSNHSKISVKQKVTHNPPNKPNPKNIHKKQIVKDRKVVLKYHGSPDQNPQSKVSNVQAYRTPNKQKLQTKVTTKKQGASRESDASSSKFVSSQQKKINPKLISDNSNNSSSNMSGKNPNEYLKNSRYLYFPDEYGKKKKFPQFLENSDKSESQKSKLSEKQLYGSIEFNKVRNYMSPNPKRQAPNHNKKREKKIEVQATTKPVDKKSPTFLDKKNEYSQKILSDIPGIKLLNPPQIESEELPENDSNIIENKCLENIVQPKVSYRNSYQNCYQEKSKTSLNSQDTQDQQINKYKQDDYLTKSQQHGKVQKLCIKESVNKPWKGENTDSPKPQSGYKFKTLGMVSKYPQIKKY